MLWIPVSASDLLYIYIYIASRYKTVILSNFRRRWTENNYGNIYEKKKCSVDMYSRLYEYASPMTLEPVRENRYIYSSRDLVQFCCQKCGFEDLSNFSLYK